VNPEQDALASRAGDFPVQLPVFTGPFRLLAELILDREVDVCDVSVAAVTQAFLALADESEGWSLEEASWFLAISAVLLELKVGRLLPRKERPETEEDLVGGAPDLAYARRLELVAFRQLAATLARRIEEAARLHPREAGPADEFKDLYPDLLGRVRPQDLAEAAVALLRPPRIDLSHVTPIVASVSEAIDDVVGLLQPRRAAMFRELVADCRDRIQVVVRFLALLELYREGRVGLRQAQTFGEIEVEWST
jgi:segregation and condensation protein A